jgi:putative molybdopterin biosynthesis protein
MEQSAARSPRPAAEAGAAAHAASGEPVRAPAAARKEFRDLVSLERAVELAASLAPARRAERVALSSALGRVVADDVVARRDVPPFTRSMMDGFAVRAEDTLEADEQRPVALRRTGVSEAGRPAEVAVGPAEAVEIATGALLPAGANAVVKVELTDPAGERVLVRRGVVPGENLMSAGDDLMAGDLVLAAGSRLGPAQIGLLAAAGEVDVSVWARPRVGVLSTGDEVRPVGEELASGQIHDINGAFLAAAVEEAGGVVVELGIAGDDREAIEAVLRRAAGRCDLVLTSGSTSAGAGDVVYRILGEGGELLAHGVRVEPGKPTALARLAGTPVVALPGNPASAAVVFDTLVAPLLRKAAGLDAAPPRRRLRATLATEIRTSPGRRLLRMVGVVGRGDRARAFPIEKRSGAISLLAQADGYVDVPEGLARLEAGTPVDVVLFEDRSALPDALFMGSHCLGLRILFRHLAPLAARSVHVGSLGGVRAVSRGVADAAGMHLLDPGGSYNVSTLERMGVRGVALVRGYLRRQGWIVPAGNPRAITGVADVLDRGARIVNRVPGSGTRLLMDELLAAEARRRGRSVEELANGLPGYGVEAATHGAVAGAVRIGTADTGLGIEAAGRLNGLDFIPVAEERYDFLVRAEALDSEFGRALCGALADGQFHLDLAELPGYRADEESGRVVWMAPEG